MVADYLKYADAQYDKPGNGWNNTPRSWGTPGMFGNTSRNPLYPFRPTPFHMDFEKVLEFNRGFDFEMHDIKMMYNTFKYHSFIHPQREDAQDSVI